MTEQELAAVIAGIAPVVRAYVTKTITEALDARAALAGPPGAPGRDGRDGLPGAPGAPGEHGLNGTDGLPGKDGVDGKDGTAGLSFEGVYQDGKSYALGHLVTWAGSSWHCNEPTTTKPGDGSKAWTLMVKRGRDGKDGVDAPGALPVVKVGGGR